MNNKPDITDNLLIRLAGSGAFERGEDYFHRSLVENLKQTGDKITAEVEGSECYYVNLQYTQQGLSGYCDCPASDSIDFCKHCVATAMVLRETLAEPDAQQPDKKPVDLICRYLYQQDKTYLVEQLADLINNDKTLRQHWQIQVEQAFGCLDKKTIRKRITAAIPYNRDYYKYHQVRQYFLSVEDALQMLREPIANLPETDQIELTDYALERIVKAQDTIDDSGGFRFDSQALLQEMHQSAFKTVPWDDHKKAEYLITTMLTDDYSMHGEIPTDYQHSISDNCLEQFYRIVQERWDALPPLTSDDWDDRLGYYRLRTILETKADKTSDYQTLIRLNLKVAQRDHDYQQLAKWSIKLNDLEQAQHFIDLAWKCPEQHRSDDTLAIQQTLWLQTDKGQQALDAQWNKFKKDHHYDDYLKLKDIAQQIEDTTDWFKTSIDHLKTLPKPTGHRTYLFSNLNDLTATIYLKEGAVDEAYQLSQQASIKPTLLHKLAQALGNDIDKVTPIYVQLAEQSVEKGNNDAYHGGISLLKELSALSTNLCHQQTMNTILQAMRTKFKIKRNFIKWLNEAFPVEDTTE